MKNLEKRVNARLEDLLEGQNLSEVLWDCGIIINGGCRNNDYMLSQGYLTQEAIDYVEDMNDLFNKFYYEWEWDVRSYYLNGEEEEFNDAIIGLTDDEIEEELHDWIDDYVYCGYMQLVAVMVTLCMAEDAQLKRMKNKLKIKGF